MIIKVKNCILSLKKMTDIVAKKERTNSRVKNNCSFADTNGSLFYTFDITPYIGGTIKISGNCGTNLATNYIIVKDDTGFVWGSNAPEGYEENRVTFELGDGNAFEKTITVPTGYDTLFIGVNGTPTDIPKVMV